jgi:hypothetical protein
MFMTRTFGAAVYHATAVTLYGHRICLYFIHFACFLAHECFVRVDGRAAIAEMGCCKPLPILETLAVKLFSTNVRNHAASPHHAKSVSYFLFVRRMPDFASRRPTDSM